MTDRIDREAELHTVERCLQEAVVDAIRSRGSLCRVARVSVLHRDTLAELSRSV